jgi:uncharacterized protein
MAQAEFLGRGWRFPIRVNGRGGLSYSSGEQSIAESIWIILSTPVNSRIMRPMFGCGIHDYVFAPNNPNTVATISNAVHRALLRWEPRIDVVDVLVQSEVETPNLLLIQVDYRIRANNAFHNLVYPFFINEGRG